MPSIFGLMYALGFHLSDSLTLYFLLFSKAAVFVGGDPAQFSIRGFMHRDPSPFHYFFRTPADPFPSPIQEPPDPPENPDVPIQEPDPEDPGQI